MLPPQKLELYKKRVELRNKLERERIKHDESKLRLEIQGVRLTLSRTGYKRCTKHYPTRGIIMSFSRRARAAKLRRIAEIDWSKTGETQFLTLTYPDEVSDHTMEERKVHRFLINRWVCKTVGKALGCFWRVEWMPRLSGRFVGELRPHMHLLYLSCPKICEMRIRLMWMSILKVKTFTQVKIIPLTVANVVGVYVAKYCAKETTLQLLDNVPKRNRSGRHAGELRKALIPAHPREVVRCVSDELKAFLARRAHETLWWFNGQWDEGFTSLGETAKEIIEEIRDYYLD